MNTKIKLAAAALLLAACDVKDPIYDTPHPDRGTITLTTDWSGIGESVQVPASYTVRVGDYSAPLSGTTHTLDNYFLSGTYRAYVYNTPEHILIDDATASVGTVTAPAGQSGPFVNSAPGWLFTCALDAAIEKDTDHTFTALMQQQVRQLTLIIEPTGGSSERIERIEGSLSGVAGSFDLNNGTHGSPSGVKLTFSLITSGTDAGKWAATVRLLGTAGAEQKLHAQIAFTDNTPQSVTLDSDLSAALTAFNADKRTPLSLGGRMIETPTGMGFDATIEQWDEVDPVEGEATLPEPVKIGDYFYSDGTWSDGGLRGIYADGSLKIADVKPAPVEGKTVIGIVFQTDPARIGEAEKKALAAKGVTKPHGLVMALKNATGGAVRWGPVGQEEGLTNCVTKEENNDDISGYGNCEHIRKAYSNFDNYLAFKAADEYNTICPAPAKTTGWYLPASGQCYDILRNLGGIEDWDAAGNHDRDYEWFDQDDVPAALNAWMVEVAPGAKDKFPAEVWLWSSSEFSSEHARDWYVGSDDNVICYWNLKDSESKVRPVLAF